MVAIHDPVVFDLAAASAALLRAYASCANIPNDAYGGRGREVRRNVRTDARGKFDAALKRAFPNLPTEYRDLVNDCVQTKGCTPLRLARAIANKARGGKGMAVQAAKEV